MENESKFNVSNFKPNSNSLKNFNFEGMEIERILLKYDETLQQREKQITDFAIQLGDLNLRLSSVNIKK